MDYFYHNSLRMLSWSKPEKENIKNTLFKIFPKTIVKNATTPLAKAQIFAPEVSSVCDFASTQIVIYCLYPKLSETCLYPKVIRKCCSEWRGRTDCCFRLVSLKTAMGAKHFLHFGKVVNFKTTYSQFFSYVWNFLVGVFTSVKKPTFVVSFFLFKITTNCLLYVFSLPYFFKAWKYNFKAWKYSL